MENEEYILSDISEYLKVKGSYAVAIAYERCLLNLTAMFPFKTAANVVAFVAGSAFGITDDKLSAGIDLFSVEAVGTKIIRVIKTASVPCIDGSVPPYFFGNSRGIFAEIFGDLMERLSLIKAIFNIDPVIQCSKSTECRFILK